MATQNVTSDESVNLSSSDFEGYILLRNYQIHKANSLNNWEMNSNRICIPVYVLKSTDQIGIWVLGVVFCLVSSFVTHADVSWVYLFQIAAVLISAAQDHHRHRFGCYLRCLLPGVTCVFLASINELVSPSAWKSFGLRQIKYSLKR